MKRRVHYHRIKTTGRFPTARISPMELGARIFDILTRAVQRHMIGLDQMQLLHFGTCQHLTRQIAPARTIVGNHGAQLFGQGLYEQA